MRLMRKQLAGMGAAPMSEDYTTILIASLPRMYAYHIDTLSDAAMLLGSPLMPDQIITAVLRKYDQDTIQSGCESKSSKDEAFVVTEHTNNTGQTKDKRNVKCHNCHKMGHYKGIAGLKAGAKRVSPRDLKRGQRADRNKSPQMMWMIKLSKGHGWLQSKTLWVKP